MQIATNTFIIPHVTLTILRKAFVLRIIFFDISFDKLEKWPNERGYNEKLVSKKILKARSQSRETLR